MIIGQYIGNSGFYLNEEGEVITDPYDKNIGKAMVQAQWEFGIIESDWTENKN